MSTRKTYSATLVAKSSSGLLNGQVTGATAELLIELTAKDAVFSELTGSAAVSGKVVAVTGPTGGDLLLQALGLFGKPGAKFTGVWTFGGASTTTSVDAGGRAEVEITTTTAPGCASIDVELVVDVKDSKYAWLLDNIVLSGDAECTKSEDVPDEQVPVPGAGSWVPRAYDGLVRGYMGSDLLADTNLAARMDDLVRLRSAFTHLLVTADLQVPKPGQGGISWMRPYVGFARTRTELTELGKRNIELLHSLGFKIHLILLNTWALKHGYSENLGSIGVDGVTESNFSPVQLENEKVFVANLLSSPIAAKLDGIMPCLEASTEHAGGFCLAIARHAKSLGFQGTLYANVIGDAYKASASALAAEGVVIAPSLNSRGAWDAATHAIRNSDGMQDATAGNTELLRHLASNPGLRGYYIWVAGSVGNSGGRGAWPDTMLIALGAKRASGGVTPTEPDAPAGDENPEQRMKRLYPGIGLGDSRSGGNYDSKGRMLPANNTTLWKPKSDSDGKLVLVVGHNMPKVLRVEIAGSAARDTLANPRTAGNGFRLNFRGPRAGSAYGSGITVKIVTVAGDVVMRVPNGGQRYEVRLAVPSEPGGPVTPKPPTTPTPPTTEPLYVRTPTTITLRADFAAVVKRVDALANNSHGENKDHIRIVATRSGNTWTIPAPLESYKVGSIPNTWRIALSAKPPAGVTYHTSIMQTFVQTTTKPGLTYPPSTRP